MTLSEIVQTIGPMLLQTTIVLAAATVIAMPVLRICRRPRVHQLVWGGVLLLGLAGMRIPMALPVAEPVALSVEVAAEPEEIISAVVAEPFSFEPMPFVATMAPEPPSIESPVMEPDTSVTGSSREQCLLVPHPDADASGSFAMIFFVVWGIGVFVQLFRNFVRYFQLQRMLRHAEPVDEPTSVLWTEILDRAGVGKRRPKLAMLSDIGPAMIRTPFGYTLLLSKSHWNELDTELRQGVMRHELAHFLHGDLWKTLFARLVVLLHWFNPLAHLAARRFEEAIEWSADSFSYGSEKNGLEQFAAAMLSLHETTPQNYRYRVAFGSKDILRRLEFLKRLKSGTKESPWKTGLVLGLSLILFVFGAVNIRIVAQEKKPDKNIETNTEATHPLSERVADLVEQIEKENLKGEKIREKIGADANDEFLQSVAEEMLQLKRSHAAVEIVSLMREAGKKDKALLSIARRQLFAAFQKPQADTSMFHKAISTASLVSDETVRDNMRSLILLHHTKCVGFEKMNQPNRFERDKKLALLLAMHVIEGPENTEDRAEGIWNIPGRRGSYVVNQYSEQTPELTLPGFTFKEKSELIDQIVRELKDPFDRGLVHESFAYALKIRIYPDWKDEYKKAAEDDARWRLTKAKVEYRKSDKPEAKKRLEIIDELFDKLELARTEIEPGKSLVGVQNYSPEHRPIHLATGNPNAATVTPDTVPDRKVLPSFPGSIYNDSPHRDKLNDIQIVYVTWDEATFKQYYETAFCPVDKPNTETEWISVLKEREPLHRRGETKFYRAINGLARLKSKAAIPELTRIATERIHKDNSYRHNSVKALGWIGDPKVVPDLIPMLYFMNTNCRLEAQVSLVRLTGMNFGYDWHGWGNWWNENRQKFGADMPAFDMKFVDWLNVGYIWYVTDDLKKHFDPKIDPRLLAYADPEVQKIQDRKFLLEKEMELGFQEKRKTLNDELEKAIRKKLGDKVRKIEDIPEAEFPKVVSTNPPMGAVNVDPSLTELSVAFDRPMSGGIAWYTRDGGATFPTRTKPLDESYMWSDDRKTNTIFNLVLEPEKTYNIWFNTEEELYSLTPGDGFRSDKNVPLRPVLFTFTTAKSENKTTELTDAEKEKKAREYYTLARGAHSHEIAVLERAISDLDNAIRWKPDFVDAYLARAEKRKNLCVQYLLDKRFDGKNYDERRKKEIEALRPALADCNEAIRLAPDNAKAYSVRAGIHIAMGHSEAEFDDETKAIELDPLPKYYANRASTFAVAQYDTAAYADFMEAKKRIKDPAEGLGFHDKTRNEVIERFGSVEKAEKAGQDFMKRKIDYVTAYRHLLRAETLYRQARPVPRPKDFKSRDQGEFRKLLEQALAECNAAIEIDPNFDGFWNQRGRVHAELGDIDDALRDYSEGIRLRPDRGDYWARATLYGKKGDLQRQLADLDKEIDIRKPDDPWLDSIKSNREKVLQKLGDAKAKPIVPET